MQATRWARAWAAATTQPPGRNSQVSVSVRRADAPDRTAQLAGRPARESGLPHAGRPRGLLCDVAPDTASQITARSYEVAPTLPVASKIAEAAWPRRAVAQERVPVRHSGGLRPIWPRLTSSAACVTTTTACSSCTWEDLPVGLRSIPLGNVATPELVRSIASASFSAPFTNRSASGGRAVDASSDSPAESGEHVPTRSPATGWSGIPSTPTSPPTRHRPSSQRDDEPSESEARHHHGRRLGL